MPQCTVTRFPLLRSISLNTAISLLRCCAEVPLVHTVILSTRPRGTPQPLHLPSSSPPTDPSRLWSPVILFDTIRYHPTRWEHINLEKITLLAN